MTAASDAERRTWDVLTRDFYWELPADLGVKLYGDSSAGPSKIQLFEVIVAAIFARLRPDYDWYVTPNRPDGGLDFVGEQRFLEDETLGIAAAITVGGQCKKRTRVDDIIQEVAGSLIRMAASLNPTFFVVALSARLNRKRVDEARAILERTHQRHCHILDRDQIEGLIHDHLPVVRSILRVGLSDADMRDVLDYFNAYEDPRPHNAVSVATPERVLAGVPFSVTVSVRSSIAAAPASRLRWRAISAIEQEDSRVTLIGPIGADGPIGVELTPEFTSDNPMFAQRSIELVTYAAGTVDLGEVLIGLRTEGESGGAGRFAVGSVQVVENVRPRFFEPPFRTCLARLAHEYDRALAGGIASIAVVGAGGGGKSRVCEEFSLERRRRGAAVVAARQSKTLDDPHRILADLFLGLASEGISLGDPADCVTQAIARYDGPLAERAEPAIRAIFGARDTRGGTVTEQSVLSSLLVLMVARCRRAPLIVHLQDLHWCAADMLILLERLVWQLEQVLAAPGAPVRAPESGVLFVFEGRQRERQSSGDDGWTSELFEAFLQRIDCTIASCKSFGPDDSLKFIGRLFENRYSASRMANLDLLELQRDLIEDINRSSGGNPFHSLEQVQLLKESGVLGQNPETGLLYLALPAPGRPSLPGSVFESIQLRWRYLKARTPELALLVWAAALLEDRVPTALFRRLWRELAPDVSLADVDATELLWTGEGEEREVVFRHENYFRSVRRFEVPERDRARVVEIYSRWFEEARRREPADQFRWARVMLEKPDVPKARALMTSALRGAQRRGDVRLARRIATTSLDLIWTQDDRAPLKLDVLLRRCDDELRLARDLLGSDRHEAGRRLVRLRERLETRLARGRDQTPQAWTELRRRKLTADVLRSQHLFNDRQPAGAAELASSAVREVQDLRRGAAPGQDGEWEVLEMEALHSHAVSLALSGEIDQAFDLSARAVGLARRSSPALGPHIISTFANILLARDPAASEEVLRRNLASLPNGLGSKPLRDEAEINLSMSLIVQAHLLQPDDRPRAAEMLAEATRLSSGVFAGCFQLGQYPDAGAAAVLLGLASAVRGDTEEVYWFAQGVAAAARGRQMETLWRAHSNLATAMYRNGDNVGESLRDHACAAMDIIEATLSQYADPTRSARFQLVRPALAQAVRYLILARDDAGVAALERYPELRSSFQDTETGILNDDRGGHARHEWLRIGSEDYVLY